MLSRQTEGETHALPEAYAQFHNKPYTMTINDEEDIECKVDSFKKATKTDKSVIVTMTTTMGVERNEPSEGIQKVGTLDQLFMI